MTCWRGERIDMEHHPAEMFPLVTGPPRPRRCYVPCPPADHATGCRAVPDPRPRRCDVPCPPANHATGRGAVPTLTFGGVFFGEFDNEIIDDVDEFRVVGFGDEAEVGSVE